MNVPGFSAEVSVYKSNTAYSTRQITTNLTAHIEPAQSFAITFQECMILCLAGCPRWIPGNTCQSGCEFLCDYFFVRIVMS